MQTITITFNEIEMEMFIKDLLSLGQCWERSTLNSKLTIKFVGDIERVKKDIYDWLNIPGRKANFEGGK